MLPGVVGEGYWETTPKSEECVFWMPQRHNQRQHVKSGQMNAKKSLSDLFKPPSIAFI